MNILMFVRSSHRDQARQFGSHLAGLIFNLNWQAVLSSKYSMLLCGACESETLRQIQKDRSTEVVLGTLRKQYPAYRPKRNAACCRNADAALPQVGSWMTSVHATTSVGGVAKHCGTG